MTDEQLHSQKLANDLMTVSGAADKAMAALHKLVPTLGELIDVDALRHHFHCEGQRAYVEVYTDDEMQAALDFHTSSVGQSILAKQPEIDLRMESSLLTFFAALKDPST